MSRFFNALEKLIFLTLIFSIPFQTRTFLFGPHSPIEEPEKFVEWNSAFLYFTDVLAVFLLGLIFLRILLAKKNLKGSDLVQFSQFIKKFKIPFIFLSAFVFFAGLSLVNAEFLDYAIYRFIKLIGSIFIFLYAATQIDFGFSGQLKNKLNFKWVVGAFLASGVFQAVIAVLQFASQESLGLGKLHESPLKIGMREVAHIKAALGPVSFGEPIGEYMDMIRAYGTFPSPNVLAGFLGVCLLLGVSVLIDWSMTKEANSELKLFSELKGFFRSFSDVLRKYAAHLIIGALFILFEGFVLAFSRGAAAFLAFSILAFFSWLYILKVFRARRAIIIKQFLVIGFSWLVAISLTFPELSSRFFPSSVSEDSVRERAYYNKIGIESVSRAESNALFGVGIGNFVSDYMENFPKLKLYLYQPVHNIYLLIASEIGLLGAGAFILFLGSLIIISVRTVFTKKPNEERYAAFVIATLLSSLFLALIGVYDHYLWSLQQGSLMFWAILGLLSGASSTTFKEMP